MYKAITDYTTKKFLLYLTCVLSAVRKLWRLCMISIITLRSRDVSSARRGIDWERDIGGYCFGSPPKDSGWSLRWKLRQCTKI